MKHKESEAIQLQRDKDDIDKVLETLKFWVSPFTSTTPGNLSSEIGASRELQCDLLQAYARGEAAMQRFAVEHIAKQDVSIYDPIPALAKMHRATNRRRN